MSSRTPEILSLSAKEEPANPKVSGAAINQAPRKTRLNGSHGGEVLFCGGTMYKIYLGFNRFLYYKLLHKKRIFSQKTAGST